MTDECVEGVKQVLVEDFGSDSLAVIKINKDSRIIQAFKYGNSYEVFGENGKNIVYVPEGRFCVPYNEIARLRLKVFKPVRTVHFIEGLTGSLINSGSKVVNNVTSDMGMRR